MIFFFSIWFTSFNPSGSNKVCTKMARIPGLNCKFIYGSLAIDLYNQANPNPDEANQSNVQ